MLRLVLFALVAAMIVFTIGAVVSVFTPASSTPTPRRSDPMPAALRNTAFVLLIVLMIGVVTGWLVPA
ncbi:MAG: hypothetical protein JJT81_05680 [Rubellimicrobium sp.]|nr:hypothetical protein [Rubellimicrobium sp.]